MKKFYRVAGKMIGTIVMVVCVAIFVSVILALPTMWLWNWLMPEIFGLKSITFLQASGLNFLCGILFKSSDSPSSSQTKN